MSVIPLSGARRERLGKGGARKSRVAGQIPGVLYGHGEIPIPVSVGSREFDLALRGHRGGNPLVTLKIDQSEYTALIRDVQYDPLSRDILHLDFQHISLTESVEVQVSIHLTGLAVGVKDGGGILEHILRSVEVRCLPTAIPVLIDVDVTALAVGDSIHARDLSVPNVTILSDPDATIATVVAPTVIEEKPAEEAVAAPASTEPEVIAKGKKEEEGEEGKDAKDKTDKDKKEKK
ncbi:MAG: 50S ribosomal protein L25 [Candidatus Eisenbacteria bacterium]|nr:50S ribosomal protein L25 [Candidatus Eisenbacteria bacterium]